MAVQVYINSTDRTGPAFKSARGNVGSLEQSVQKATRAFKLLSVAAVGVGVKAVKDFADFDNRIREISTLLGDVTERDIKNLGNEIKKTAITYGQSLDKMAKARYDIISAGFNDAARSAIVLEQSAKLAVGGVSEVSTTADVLTTALNAYGLEADKAQMISDTLFTTVRLGKTTVDQLAASFGDTASIAPTVGVSIQELAAMFATLTAAGQNTAEAGTAITATMSAFLSPSEAMTDKLEKMGFATGSAAIKALGFQEALKRITDGTNEAEKAALFPNVRAMRSVFPLVGVQADKFNENLKEMKNVAGATDTAVEKMSKGIAFQMKQMKARIDAEMTNIGEKIVVLVNQFLNLPKTVKDAAAAFGILAIAIYGLGAPVTAIITGIYLLWRSWDIVFAGLKIIWENFVVAIKIGVSEATQIWDDLVAEFKEAGAILKAVFTGSWSEIGEIVEEGNKKQKESDEKYTKEREEIWRNHYNTVAELGRQFNTAVDEFSILPDIFSDSSGLGGPSITPTEDPSIAATQAAEEQKLEIKRNFAQLEAELRADDQAAELESLSTMKDIQIGYTQEMFEAEKQAFRQRNILWKTSEAAYGNFVSSLTDFELTGKQRREAVWQSVKAAFITTIGDMVKEYILSEIVKRRFADAGMTAAVVKGTAVAGALGAAYATPAAFASVMSFGGAAATGASALAGAVGAAHALRALPIQEGSSFVSNGAFSGTDTVPAILSPGEAVIPASVVRNNTTVVQQLVGRQEPTEKTSNKSVKVSANFSVNTVDADGFEQLLRSNKFRNIFIDLINEKRINLEISNDQVVGIN